MFISKVTLFACIAAANARSLPNKVRARNAATAGTPAVQSTICGDIVADVDKGFTHFLAEDAYQCLTSVPFNPSVATRFLKYWNETVQFQSTLAYLKNPPAGYQQPPVDVVKEVAKIQERIDSGYYTNQYKFESEFQLLTYALHDGHVRMVAGALSAFMFAAPFEIASVSIDGKSPPKIYMTEDILEVRTQDWKPSAIKTINGEDVVEFLTKFAALNSWGYVEPHAEWNALMSSPVQDILGGGTVWAGGATFYPGSNLTVHFENYTASDNSTFYDTTWLATYTERANYTGPLTTGGDFYNYFVLGNLPASFNDSAIVVPNDEDPELAAGNWSRASFLAFPENPAIAQYDLDLFHSGFVSGYFYKDISTGVLSLPTFDVLSQTLGNYTDTVGDFIIKASEEGLEKIVIDVQRNTGGAVLLAYTIFKYFFPDLSPFAGSRRRSFPSANELGSIVSGVWELLEEDDEEQGAYKQLYAANEWVITNRINSATGRNFTDWEEYANGVSDNGDKFSLVQQYDMANEAFDRAAFNEWYPTMYMSNKTEWPIKERPFNPEQIVILTDGICSSACSLLIEMMTRVGVKTVVAGGRPQPGPMQAASGNRGAAVYAATALDNDIAEALEIYNFIDNTTATTLPSVRETGMDIRYASINLRDQIRKDEKVPLQFKYEAADCRIYFTFANLYNTTQLWRDVAATMTDKSRCVEGSTGFSTTNNTNPSPAPKRSTKSPTLDEDINAVTPLKFDETPEDGLQAGTGTASSSPFACPPDVEVGQKCSQKAVCRLVPLTCAEGKRDLKVCLPDCTCQGNSCNCEGTCVLTKGVEHKVRGGDPSINIKTPGSQGQCWPNVGTKKLGCKASPPQKPRI
ncbi:hypothetical protein DM02DRAFT_156160 [Periconia macrospinosa]|uniref:Uncharacterized protein n=1 Tax=Periconia macrospinosa TaxID=97972 RepID=A0A2V1EG02_9PLEO|nr:hypothetical protein DM02DRAFT_156160 [Periconia macrospinosa]